MSCWLKLLPCLLLPPSPSPRFSGLFLVGTSLSMGSMLGHPHFLAYTQLTSLPAGMTHIKELNQATKHGYFGSGQPWNRGGQRET